MDHILGIILVSVFFWRDGVAVVIGTFSNFSDQVTEGWRRVWAKRNNVSKDKLLSCK